MTPRRVAAVTFAATITTGLAALTVALAALNRGLKRTLR